MTVAIKETVILPTFFCCSSIPKAYCLNNRMKSCHECDNLRSLNERAGYTLVEEQQKDRQRFHCKLRGDVVPCTRIH